MADSREKQRLLHPFPPLYDKRSRILILGSFPSIKSREQNFFYGHPQNRFWKVMAAVLDCETPRDIPAKRDMLLRHGIALWDSIGSCEIRGSSDASIDKAAPNDLSPIFRTAEIRQVFCNGKKSHEMYQRFQEKELGRSAICLPSTSPANAAWSIERLSEEWARQIRPFL